MSNPKNNPENTPDTSTPTSDDLLALIEQQGEIIAVQNSQIAKLEETIDALQAKNPIAKSSAAAVGTFTVGNKEYRVVHGIRVRRNGVLATVPAAEILKDQQLREKLVADKSSAVQAV